MAKMHTLKVWPHFFHEIVCGRKNFDVRDARDRIFQAGDEIQFVAWDPKRQETVQGTPPLFAYITAVYSNVIGVDPAYVVLSIRPRDGASR